MYTSLKKRFAVINHKSVSSARSVAYKKCSSTDLDRSITMCLVGHVVVTIAGEKTRSHRDVNLRPLDISGRGAQFQDAFLFISIIIY